MEPLSFLVVIVFWIIVSVANNKKKTPAGKGAKPAGTERRAPPSRRPAAKPRAQQIDWSASVGEKTPAHADQSAEGISLEGAPEGEDPCHEDILRPAQPARVAYEPASEAQFSAAGEGEDPCHPTPERKHSHHPEQEETDAPYAAFAREDLVRAVVMSEILTRPKDRKRMRR